MQKKQSAPGPNGLNIFRLLKHQMLKDSFEHRRIMFHTYLKKFGPIEPIYLLLNRSPRFLKTTIATAFGVINSARSFPAGENIAFYQLQNEKSTILWLTQNCTETHFLPVNWRKSLGDRIFAILFFWGQLIFEFKKSIQCLRILYMISAKQELYVLMRTAETLFTYLFLRERLGERKPKRVLFSSEGNPYGFALFHLAPVLHFESIFASHASISGNPSPVFCDLAIFHSKKAASVYLEQGSQFEQILYYPFQEQFSPVAEIDPAEVSCVFVGLSKDSPESGVKSTVDMINATIRPRKILIRVHPQSLVGAEYENYAHNVTVTRNSPIREDFHDVDLAINGNSNVHLDCLLVGIPSLYHSQIDRYHEDQLLFLREKLILKLNPDDDVPAQIVRASKQYASKQWQNAFAQFINIDTSEVEFFRQLREFLADESEKRKKIKFFQ